MSRIIKTTVQAKGDKEPKEHFALVFDGISDLSDFMFYRNALTTAAKTLASSDDFCTDEIFWLIQLAEFISSSLDYELYWKKIGNGQS